jgi:hypothetical protein
VPPVRSIARIALVAAGTLLAGWLVLAITVDRVFARTAPALALRWNPLSADAGARQGDLLLAAGAANPARTDWPRIRHLAARSLDRQPVNPVAARLLGLAAEQGGNAAQAGRLVRYAEAMSRRDRPTQFWLIRAEAARGDMTAVLLHYDRALRSSNRVRATLFPALGIAADDPSVRAPLARVLAAKPVWWRPFLDSYVPRARSADSLFLYARTLRLDRAPPYDPWLLQGFEKRLVDLGAFAGSAALYNAAHGLPAGDRTPLRNGGFEQPGNWDPFDWNLLDEENLSAVRQPAPAGGGGRGNALFLLATNGRGGDVASQLTLLAPGRYRLTATVGGVEGDPLAFPQAVVRCPADRRELVRATFPPAPDIGRSWQLEFTVPAGCTAQRVTLSARSTLDAQETAPWIDELAIRPLRNR